MKKTLTNILLLALSLAAAFLLAEGLVRAWLWLSPETSKQKLAAVLEDQIRRETSPAYAGAPFFNPEFVAETGRVYRNKHPDRDYVVPEDLAGKYINVVRSRRATSDAPAAWTNRLLLFGGSTAFNGFAPDSETIASNLQRLLNGRGLPYLVENYGVNGMNASQQTMRLVTTPLSRGDVVVYYSGVNEINWVVYKRHKEVTPMVRRLSWYGWVLYKYRNRFKTARLLYDLYARRLEVENFLLEVKLAKAAEQYFQTLGRAKAYCDEHGARFVNFLQPNLYENRTLTAFEQKIVEYFNLNVDIRKAYQDGYPLLRQELKRARQDLGVESFDISGLLNDLPRGREYFFDPYHVNWLANRLIAARIADSAFGPARAAGR
ncbi:MAG: hypothetical protein JW718_08905 [Desulfovibrionaceae bacterium]|nr:hypothetical protein [Desulfovibrionaceae bacterium]